MIYSHFNSPFSIKTYFCKKSYLVFMKKEHLSFKYDLLVNYPIIGRMQPVTALNEAISKLGTFNKNVTDFNGVISKFGTVNKDDYEKFRYLQLELIVKQCELLSDIAGYINAIEKFSPKQLVDEQSVDENHKMVMNIYKHLVCSTGTEIHDFYTNLESKDDQFFFELMGYDILHSFKPFTDIPENLDALKNSVKIVRSIFNRMSHFYKSFWHVYNAYKHGYRLFINRAQCDMIECSGVSGNLDVIIQDTITYAAKFGEPNKVISFSRIEAVYNNDFFNLFQGIVNAFTIRLVTLYQGFINYDMSDLNPPSIRVFLPNGEYSDVSLKYGYEDGGYHA